MGDFSLLTMNGNKMQKRLKEEVTISREWTTFLKIKSFLYKHLLQKVVYFKNSKKKNRSLEIGPGEKRIEGFETINIIKNKNTDYVGDAAKILYFPDNTFDIIYASHILEHVPWYQVEKTLKEWVRVLKKGGVLEVWVPDSLKIAKAFWDAEKSGKRTYLKDGWFRFNEEKDPAKWFSGRMYSYGDGRGTKRHYNYHLAAFSERYLKELFRKVGLKKVERMVNIECRGHDHGWINLGVKGVKK